MSPINADNCSVSCIADHVSRVGGAAALLRRSGSFHQWIKEAGYELGQVGLTLGAGFLEDVAEMGLYRRGGNAENLGDLRHASNVNDGEQDPEFRHRQLV